MARPLDWMLLTLMGTAGCVTPNPYEPPTGGTPNVGSGIAQLRFETSSLTRRITKIELDGKVVCGATGAPSCNPSANVYEMEFVTAATPGEHRLKLVVEKGRRWQSGPWKSYRLPAQRLTLAEGEYRCDIPDPEADEPRIRCSSTDSWTRQAAGSQPAPAKSPVVSPAPGCAKDTDCKGERVCRDGRCADPTGSAACGRDTHCKGDRLCRDGACVDP